MTYTEFELFIAFGLGALFGASIMCLIFTKYWRPK